MVAQYVYVPWQKSSAWEWSSLSKCRNYNSGWRISANCYDRFHVCFRCDQDHFTAVATYRSFVGKTVKALQVAASRKAGVLKGPRRPPSSLSGNSGLANHQHAQNHWFTLAFSSSSFDWFCTPCANETARSWWCFQNDNACWQHHFWKLQSTNRRCHLC